MRLLLFLIVAQTCFPQADWRGPGYRNSDPPNCGSFHVRKIQGSVMDPSGAPIKEATVEVFDDVSHRPLGKTTTDEAGRFSVNQTWSGRLRVVFSSPGFLTNDLAVTIASWPAGGLLHLKELLVELDVLRGDGVAICRPGYSR